CDFVSRWGRHDSCPSGSSDTVILHIIVVEKLAKIIVALDVDTSVSAFCFRTQQFAHLAHQGDGTGDQYACSPGTCGERFTGVLNLCVDVTDTAHSPGDRIDRRFRSPDLILIPTGIQCDLSEVLSRYGSRRI